jgi:hypothetical protein
LDPGSYKIYLHEDGNVAETKGILNSNADITFGKRTDYSFMAMIKSVTSSFHQIGYDKRVVILNMRNILS